MPDPAHPHPPGADPAPDLWRFGPDDAPVLVENADALLAYLPYFLGGWPFRWYGDAAGAAPDVRVIETADGGWRIVSSGPGAADFAFDNPYDAANGLAGALISVHVARRSGLICLHAAAAEIAGALVLLVGDSFAGKSSVALHLAVRGHRFFGDDQIALSLDGTPTGTCLGLMPKVRTPLPDDCGDAFREFVEGYTAMEGEGMVYLKLWEGEAGTFGDAAPVRAAVLLDRRDAGGCDLLPAPRADLLKALVPTAFAPHVASADLVAGLARLANGVDLRRLRFSSSREAAALLSETYR